MFEYVAFDDPEGFARLALHAEWQAARTQSIQQQYAAYQTIHARQVQSVASAIQAETLDLNSVAADIQTTIVAMQRDGTKAFDTLESFRNMVDAMQRARQALQDVADYAEQFMQDAT